MSAHQTPGVARPADPNDPPRAKLHLSEMRGMPCLGGQYELRVTTPGPMTGRHLRNIIRMLEMTATLHEEDEASEIVAAHREGRG